ncbi:MAG: tetratricopeptide repeat protein [Gemmatimonadetes bacterium]|nr:tetratricopeptide repeat protein [Gemmatimonadota bacterium]
MNFEKLKETARKYEQKEEWRRAIEVYLQAIREFEAGNDPVPDLSVYNRVGDLYLKANEPGAAVQAYERAADLYGEQGFYNNAIALCGKILRVNPGRIQTYLKLAQLHARKNVVIEAKKNLLEYLERMNALSQLDEAFKAVKDFADQFPANKEIRLMLSELLRASSRNAEAREQLEKLASDLEARGDTIGARKTLMRLQAIDAEEGAPPAAAPEPAKPTGPRPRSGDLVFLDVGAAEHGAPAPAKPAGPPSRKTRAISVRPTVQNRPPAGLPLIDVGDAVAASAEPVVSPEPLAIETSSLVQTPLELESVQKISDEAVLEATAQGDVAKALGFEPTEVEGLDQVQVQPLDGLEVDRAGGDGVELHVSLEGLQLERASEPATEDVAVTPIHTDAFLVPDPLDLQAELADDLGLGLGEGDIEPSPSVSGGALSGMDLLEPGSDESEIDPAGAVEEEMVTFLDASEPEQPSIADLEDRVLEDPDDPEAHRVLGEALLAAGETLRGQEELELALAGYEGREDWGRAADLVLELIRLDPNGVRYHQKRVEIAFHSGERSRLIDAYVELADALLRVGALDKALAVYRRVSEHDPGNQRALAALDALSPVEESLPPIPPLEPAPAAPETEELDQALDAAFEPPAPAPAPAGRKSRKSVAAPRPPAPPKAPEPVAAGGDFIDLGALIMDDDRVKDSRMRVEDEEPTGDEQKDFQDMLQAFKRGIDENIDAEDYQAHYDLGVAFKEMGLLDEAIAEFQKALRSPEGRLKTSEALGTAFYEKGQFAIAEAILKRAVESLGATDDEQIGLIYWLARSLEAQHKPEPAITTYERVMAVDIGFMDASGRMARLSAGRAQ